MRRISVNVRALSAYVFVLILCYLAGTYVAPFYFYLYVFMIVLPLYCLVQVVVSKSTLQCVQTVDADSPVKGDLLHYQVWVTGRPFLTTEAILHFRPVHSRLPYRIPDIRVALTGSRLVEESIDVRLRHRGTYTIGLEEIKIVDPLGWLSLRKEESHRTFIVRPRILPLVPPIAETRVHALSESGANGVEQDLTMLEGLSGYREGEPVKHIAWKKYFTTGAPYLKQFGGSSEPAVTVYLDLRFPSGLREDDYEVRQTTEDCSIEMAISLVKSYLDRGIRVGVRSVGESLYSFVGSGPADFERFYSDTDILCFAPTAPSPARLYESDRSDGIAGGSVLFVTHLADEELFETASERCRNGDRTGVFLNLTAMGHEQRELADSYGRMLRSIETGMYFSAHEETLVEDLRTWKGKP